MTSMQYGHIKAHIEQAILLTQEVENFNAWSLLASLEQAKSMLGPVPPMVLAQHSTDGTTDGTTH